MPERQTGELEDIRPDHLGRYEFAAKRVSGNVLDAACGCGYGSRLMSGLSTVKGIDIAPDAIEFANSIHKNDRVQYEVADVRHVSGWFDWIVCFETLEHIEQDGDVLRRFRRMAPRLLLSVPNETRLPFAAKRFPYHIRHYTFRELDCLCRGSGWQIQHVWSQPDRLKSDVEPGSAGYTIIISCV